MYNNLNKFIKIRFLFSAIFILTFSGILSALQEYKPTPYRGGLFIIIGEPRPEPNFKQADFEDRQLIVRAYKKGRNDLPSYILASRQVKDGCAYLELEDPNNTEFVAIFGEDQEDELFKKVFAGTITGSFFSKGMCIKMPPRFSSDTDEDSKWTFFDALRNPVANAEVDTYILAQEKMLLINKSRLDSDGNLILPVCPKSIPFYYPSAAAVHPSLRFIVSHPDYGRSMVQVKMDTDGFEKQSNTLFIPAVPKGSEAEKRSASGVLTDSNGNPLAAMPVWLESIQPPGGNFIHSAGEQRSAKLTGSDGRFHLYMPLWGYEYRIGSLIPPKTNYTISIRPPAELGFMPYIGWIPAGEETKIALEKGGYFHTFCFEFGNEIIGDANNLRKIEVHIARPGKLNLRLKYDDYKDGYICPAGTYYSTIFTDSLNFSERIEVNENSPQNLVFRREAKKYYGRVVNGITGQLYKGAYVIDMMGRNDFKNFSMLTSENWKSLKTLPDSALLSDKSLREILWPLSQFYSFSQIVRTDSNGCYEMKIQPENNRSNIAVFDANYLTVIIHQLDAIQKNPNTFEFPVAKLFPSAKISLQPFVENDNRDLLIEPRWIVDENNTPPWINDFLACCYFDDFNYITGIRKDFYLEHNKHSSFDVPADVNLQIQLLIPGSNDWSPMMLAESITLQQGQNLELGKVQILPSVIVLAKVVDSKGQPVEAVPVQAVNRYGTRICNTDEGGVAIFKLAGNSTGEFVVEYYQNKQDPNALHLRQSVPYSVGIDNNLDNPYTLTISDELLGFLLK